MDRKHRRQLLVDPSFQIQFIMKFCIIVVATSLLIGGSVFILTRGSTTVAIENTKVVVKPTSDFILPSLSATVLIASIFSALVVIILALFISHGIVGPIVRLQREIDLMQKGNMVRNFNIRNKDKLRALARSLDSMASTLRGKHKQVQDTYYALMNYLEEKDFCVSPKDKEKFSQMLTEVNNALKYFKV